MLATILLAPLLPPWLPAGDGPDRVRLASGEELGGRVVYEDAKRVVLRADGREVVYPRGEVADVRSLERSLELLLARYDQLAPNGSRALADLARFAEGRGLDGEARLLWLATLEADGDSAEARRALADGWSTLRPEGRSNALDELRERHRAWERAWVLPTTHWELRTNLPLPDAVHVALDLERVYLTVVDLLQAAVEVHHLDERQRAEIHAAAGSFPPGPTSRDAWFDRSADVLHVDASVTLRRERVFHEAVHQLLSNLLDRQRKRPFELPAWLDEGLAEYFATSMVGEPGRAWFRERVRQDAHFRRHARASEPLTLDALLDLGHGAFWSGDDVELAYAQSYSFVHFLLEGDGRRYREGLFAFLRSAARGQAAPTHLEKIFAPEFERLEPAWHAYARRMAGG